MGIYKKVPRSGPILVQKDLNVGAERLRNCLATNCNCFFFIPITMLYAQSPRSLNQPGTTYYCEVIANTHCQKSSTCI